MSTTIAKAFGNLEQANNAKERKRYSQARKHSVPRSQQTQVPTAHLDELDQDTDLRSAQATDDSEPVQSLSGSRRSARQDNARSVRSSMPMKKRGQDRRVQRDPRGHFPVQQTTARDDRQRGYTQEQAPQGRYPEQSYDDTVRNQHFADDINSYDLHRDEQYPVQDDYRAPLPHRAQHYQGYDNRVNQPQPRHASQPESEPRVVKSNGKMLRLPVNRMRAKNMITLDQPRSMLAEQYRAIRMALMNNARRPSADGMRPRSNLLMVTSALAGEGKTYTSTNLALSISMEQDKSVLLMDADSSKGSLSRLLGVPKGTPGLMDVLMDDSLNIEDVILKTDVPRFTIIPRGTPNEYATDLFSSGKMQKLLFELSTRYDNRIVMLDTSPLLMTTEARALANFVDQIPFVVGAENTTHESVEESLSYLSPEKYVGMILNMATKQTRAKYGYY